MNFAIPTCSVLTVLLSLAVHLPVTHAYTQQQCALYQLMFYTNFHSRFVGQRASLGRFGYFDLNPLGRANPDRNRLADCYMKVPVNITYTPDDGYYTSEWIRVNGGHYVYIHSVVVREAIGYRRVEFEMDRTGEGTTPPGSSIDLSWFVFGQLGQWLSDSDPYHLPIMVVPNPNRRNLRGSGIGNETLALEENENFKKALLAWGTVDEYKGILGNMTNAEIKEWKEAMTIPFN